MRNLEEELLSNGACAQVTVTFLDSNNQPYTYTNRLLGTEALPEGELRTFVQNASKVLADYAENRLRNTADGDSSS